MKPHIELSKELVTMAASLLPATPKEGRVRLCPVKTELALLAYARGMEMILPTCSGIKGSFFEEYIKKNPRTVTSMVDYQLLPNENKGGFGLRDRFTGHKPAEELEAKLALVRKDTAGDYYFGSYAPGNTGKLKGPKPAPSTVKQFGELKKNWKDMDLRSFHAEVGKIQGQLLPEVAR